MQILEKVMEEGPQLQLQPGSATEGKYQVKALEFISEMKSCQTYQKDLKMWFRMTKIEKKHQAKYVVYHLDGHLTKIRGYNPDPDVKVTRK